MSSSAFPKHVALYDNLYLCRVSMVRSVYVCSCFPSGLINVFKKKRTNQQIPFQGL